MLCRYFLQVCGLSLHFHNSIPWRAEDFYFDIVQLTNFFFYAWRFLYPGPEFEPRSVGGKVLPLVTFSVMFPQNLSSDQCQAGTPQNHPGSVLKIQSPGSPPWGICFCGLGQTWECVYVTTPQVTVWSAPCGLDFNEGPWQPWAFRPSYVLASIWYCKVLLLVAFLGPFLIVSLPFLPP